MGWGEAKDKAAKANQVNSKARRFHEAGRSEQERLLDELKDLTGSQKGAENAIKDAGGAGRTALRKFLGR